MLQEKKSTLQEHSKKFLYDLKQLHINFDKTQVYPRYDNFDSAIFDNERKLIFSSSDTKIKLDKILYLHDKVIHLVNIPESYYLGAKYVIIKVKDDGLWLKQTRKEIILFVSLTFVFMMAVGYVLLRLFLKPMRDAIQLLDRFIKDTTHELNTPVSTIVANIEMIDKSSLDEKLLKKINRIDIGAKTISNIYQDLTYLTLGNKIMANDEDLNIEQVVLERIEYFNSLATAKKVSLKIEIIQNTSLYIDKGKFSKLLDNLISNAIKYNKIKGSIIIRVEARKISVEDSGIGIAEEDISQMLERYTRFNKSSGGFGIGLNIVASIAKEYSLDIDIQSELKVGTTVSVSW
ncbi:MAG: two-component system OmpR family sensor kinase [Sulfurimonas sp.]|jgi:two-component system OmpR family sensor kinase|uniref:sensor histidine kinase n=1 Tax=Sulfurimonas sp. TaxID=2022749 RepID=UPI0039E27443